MSNLSSLSYDALVIVDAVLTRAWERVKYNRAVAEELDHIADEYWTEITSREELAELPF